ncbi:MAG: hypothetical protein R3D44_04295 [Hyphomicrobiaceae bacterium]
MDLNVLFFESRPTNSTTTVRTSRRIKVIIERPTSEDYSKSDRIFVRHSGCSAELKREASRCVRHGARRISRLRQQLYIAAIGTEEQAAAFERAARGRREKTRLPRQAALIAAGVALRNSDWAGSVRESIHAVEAMAMSLAPGTKDTWGQRSRCSKSAATSTAVSRQPFGSLYGYSSDEEGVQHALVFADEAQLDEADALFYA